MELLQLRYFLEGAKTGSFAKTAEKFMVPASSVSASIRRLEDELGQKLFSRTANRVTLNENGKHLLETVSPFLRELDQTVNDIANPPDRQVFRLLVLSYRHPITDLIVEYRKKHPGAIFDLCMDYNIENFRDYDIIIGTSDLDFPGYSHFDLRTYRIYLKVADNHPLRGKNLTLSQLREQPFATMGGNMHNIIVSACKRVGFTPNIIATVNDTMCYNKLIRNSDVIGHRRSADHSPAPGFAHLNVTDFNEYQSIRVYYKEPANAGSIKNFLEFLKAAHT